LDLAAQVTLDLVVALDVISEDCQLLGGDGLGTLVGTDARALQDLDGPGPSDAESVRERDLHPLGVGLVDACYACHVALLVRRSVCLPPDRPRSVWSSPDEHPTRGPGLRVRGCGPASPPKGWGGW